MVSDYIFCPLLEISNAVSSFSVLNILVACALAPISPFFYSYGTLFADLASTYL